MNSEIKNCQNCKNDFIIEPDDFIFYEKIKVPPPTFCPQCRLIRRLARRNERSFYYGKCEKCHKKVISVFSEESKTRVYCGACWYADDWDGLEYGIDFDPSKVFLTELNTLFKYIPMMNLWGLHTTKVNSDYTNMVSWLKNCYMVTYSDYCENVLYGSFVNHSRDSVDNFMGKQLELCYESINCNQCYQTCFSIDCESCSNVWFSKNCTGCMNCFGCVNLKSKSYYIYNEPYSKEAYEQKLKEFFPLSGQVIEDIQRTCEDLFAHAPQKYMHGWRNIGSSGDYLNDTKNAKNCFVGFNMEDCKFCSFVTGKITDTYDFVNFGESSSRMYEVFQGGDQCADIRMSHWAISNCYNLDYCLFCINSQDLFGCVGLKKRQYCIFNKQYSKEEYFKLRAEIIHHMNENPYVDRNGLVYKYGEFFPVEMSPFPYNDTTAQEFFPLSKEEALSNGYWWRDEDKRNYEITMLVNDIPHTIGDVSDEIIDAVIECSHKGTCAEKCTGAFQIKLEELQFYRRMKLPLPQLCPNCRHGRRLRFRNPMKLWERTCMCDKTGHLHGEQKCEVTFETSYAPYRQEIVYCEKCYQQEVL